jgi:hypothetical protein
MYLLTTFITLFTVLALVVIAAIILGYTFKDDLYVGPVDVSVSSQCPSWLSERCRLPRVDPIPSWASMVCLAIGLTSLATSVDVLLPEWGIVARQRRAGVNILTYYLARNIADGVPNILIPPLVFCAVFYFFLELNQSFLMFYLIVMVTQFTCIGLGYFASLVAQPAPFLAGCVIVLISIAFSGVQPTLKDLNSTALIGFLSNFSFARWAVEAIYISEITPLKNVFDIIPGLNALSYGLDPMWPLAMLAVLGVGFRLGALFVYSIPYIMRRLNLSKYFQS